MRRFVSIVKTGFVGGRAALAGRVEFGREAPFLEILMIRFTFLLSLFTALAFGLTGCLGAADEPAKKPEGDGSLPKVDPADMKALVQGNNEFAFDLYKQLSKKEGNKFFSPYSISTALGMTFAGARGNTAKEMAQTLHFTLDNERLHPASGELIRKIQGADKKRNYELAVANSLWGKTGLSLEPKFLRITQTDYQAGFHHVDFGKDPEGARQTINAWVEDKTNKKIKKLIPPGYIDSATRLVLANAIYFKADWNISFPESATKPEDFNVPGDAAFKVPMMNHTLFASYTENADFQMAQFLYKDNEASMVIILPRKMDGLAEVEKKLSAEVVEKSLVLMGTRELKVTVPKFKLTEHFRLAHELDKLGIHDAFRPKIADFTGMEVNVSREDSLSISEVLHKAYVDVDEKGTEAAAATAVTMTRTLSAKPVSPPPTPFRADHPFLFLIRHNGTGSILFMGRVLDPRGDQK